MERLLGNGKIIDAEIDDSISLRREIASLKQELRQALAARDTAARELVLLRKGISSLREKLSPLYNSLRQLFGELDSLDVDDQGSPSVKTNGLSPKWQMMKEKLGHREAQIIDALQHGSMTAKQLTPVLHWDIKTVYRVTQKMKDAGLLNNEGGKFSLREL
jgi:chromosome segregation ATPase